jgi:hypothetical protein
MKSAQALVAAGEVQPPVRVDDWPNPSYDLKTLTVHTYDFVGRVVIQASLLANPTEADWFDVYVETFEKALPHETKVRNRLFNTRDRYIVMRAKVEQVFGRVDRIMVI